MQVAELDSASGWEVMQGLTTLAVTTVWEQLASSARLSRCWHLQCGTQLPHLPRSCGHGLEVSLPLNAHKATLTNSFPGHLASLQHCSMCRGHHPEPHLLVPTLLGLTFQTREGETGFPVTMAKSGGNSAFLSCIFFPNSCHSSCWSLPGALLPQGFGTAASMPELCLHTGLHVPPCQGSCACQSLAPGPEDGHTNI